MNHGNCGLAEIVEFVSRMIHGRDPNLAMHHERVGVLCGQYAKHVHMEKDATDTLIYAARLHDIGKQGISLAIIDKVTPLTVNEMEAIRRHTTYGVQYAEPLCLPEQVVQVILHHHEDWDGTGYNGLAGTDIPEFARIVRVADSIDAIQHARAYKGGNLPVAEVIDRLSDRAEHYDARVLAVFTKILNDGRKR